MARLTYDDYAAREMRLMGRLGYAMRLVGWRVDTALVATHVRSGEARLAEGRDVLKAHGFPEVNANGTESKKPHATKQGNESLKAALSATGVKPESWMFTDTGKVVTSKDVWTPDRVAVLPEQARLVIETILDMNGVRTVYGTVKGNQVGDRVYPEVMPFQATGRFSIQSPGLTVMGKRGGKHVERSIFLPEPGDRQVSFDLNQVDARAVAMHCQDANYVALFTDPSIDSHAEIAYMVWGDRALREDAKKIGHGWNYGEGLYRIAREAGVDMSVAEEFDRQMRVRFPRLVEWQQEVRDQAQSGVLMDNGMGRMMRPTPGRSHTQGPALMGQGLARDLLMEGLLALPVEYVRDAAGRHS
ncbi:MAG: DNA polymerase [Candidatus Nanopelagicales bacterium]